MYRCCICGKSNLDICVIDSDKPFCTECYRRIMDKLCEIMEKEREEHIREEIQRYKKN